MEIYRIYNRRYEALDGVGAAMIGGRWNPVGSPAVYAARTFEGALLEQLVHANTGSLPRNRRAAAIQIPDDVSVLELDPEETPGWEKEAVSQTAGREWLARAESVAWVVPSVVARPWGRNVVLNPVHPDFARITVREEVDLSWDPRLGSSASTAPPASADPAP